MNKWLFTKAKPKLEPNRDHQRLNRKLKEEEKRLKKIRVDIHYDPEIHHATTLLHEIEWIPGVKKVQHIAEQELRER